MTKLYVSKDLTLPLDAATMTFAILAVRGAGKTYWALVMAEEMVKSGIPIVFVDPIGVAWGLRATADGKYQGLPVVILGGERGDVPLEPGSGESIADWVVTSRQPCVLDLSLMRKAEQVRFMTAFAEKLYLKNRKPLHVFLDEADTFAPQKPMSNELRMLGALEDLVKKGRARGIGCTMITQRAAVLNKNVLTQIESLICLRTISPQDRKAIQSWVDIHGTEEQLEEFRSSVASLPRGEAYFWSPGWLGLFKRVHARERDTFDSSSTPKVGSARVMPKHLGPIEIEALKTQLSDAIERKKQEDPTFLREELLKVKSELSKKKKEIESLKKELGAVQDDLASYASMITKEQEERQKVSRTLTDDELSAIKGVSVEISSVSEKLIEVLKSNVDMLSEIRNRLDQKAFMAATTPLVPPPRRAPPAATRAPSPPRQMKAGEEWNDLGRCARAMLLVLAQKSPCTAQQLAILSQYSLTSSGFANSLSDLRTNGFAEGGRDALRLTTQGSRIIPAGAVRSLPRRGELVDHWVAKLSKASGTMLRALCEAWPKALTKEQLSEATGYSTTSSGFANALSTLNVLELIVKIDSGHIKASNTFFE